ncbi:hypothetical protein MSP8886_02023 [Marinomonas spartinae]|uniref:Uncharacterized protein n=1 Tax=Marinomonas spartinae TaxID=1792290 RepID=A0A1A8TGR5_9GAMM|nr:hypothetical protein [Marinomonas spartinae]SBS31211.1 hypothetical protein MSP8886_02023 [Marinomonas spartinae]
MEIKISELIALFSLIVAFLAYRHAVKSSLSTAKQMQRISEDHLQLTSNVALTESSQKYVRLLSKVNGEFEKIVKSLSYPALKASTEIGETLDRYDNSSIGHPYLRHCFHNAITVVREAYDHELTYQTGLNLTSRVRSLKFIKDDVSHYENTQPEKSIFSFLKKERAPSTPEEYINLSTVFWDSVKEIYTRIPSNKEAEVFKDTLSVLKEYIQLHESKREILENLESELEQAIKENSLEMFEIRDIPNLGQKFYRVKGDIGRFRELYSPDFHGIESAPVTDGISYSIYAGSIAFIASQHFMWGKI